MHSSFVLPAVVPYSFVGVTTVSHTVVASMPIRSGWSYTDVARNVRTGKRLPIYYCRAVAYAPFVVRADYGWQSGPLSGDGGSALYLWLFGSVFRIRELDHWAS
jgi:hypothetical protein